MLIIMVIYELMIYFYFVCRIQGFLNIYRSFYINSVWGGCASDAGWLMVYDTHNVGGCPWEGYYLSDKPAILYSPISTRVRFSQSELV